MPTREDAQMFMEKLYSCIPRFFYSEIETIQRGVGFTLSYLEQANGEVNAGELSKSYMSVPRELRLCSREWSKMD